MESKFEILSYQNCNDLKKAINPSSVLIGAVTLLLGLYLAIFVSVSDPTSNLNMRASPPDGCSPDSVW